MGATCVVIEQWFLCDDARAFLSGCPPALIHAERIVATLGIVDKPVTNTDIHMLDTLELVASELPHYQAPRPCWQSWVSTGKDGRC